MAVVNSEARANVQRLSDIRRANLAAVLRYVDRNPGSSQTDISGGLGLASGAVTSLVGQLEDIGVIAGGSSVGTSRRGRPRRSLELAAGSVVVGVEVSIEEIQVLGRSLNGNELFRSAEELGEAPRDASALGKRALQLVDRLLSDLPGKPSPLTVSIAVPGVVAGDEFAVPAFWNGFQPSAATFRWRPEPCTGEILNDGDAAVFAELHLGQLRGTETAIAVHGSDGIAGGLVSAGELLTGHLGLAGEVGHIVVDRSGPRCECGLHGCLGTMASVRALARYLGESALPRTETHRAYAERLAARAVAGEDDVLNALDRARDYLGFAMRTLSAVISPEFFVLTGNLVPLANWVIPRIPSEIEQSIWDRPVTVSASSDSVLLGAAEWARRRVLGDPVAFLGP